MIWVGIALLFTGILVVFITSEEPDICLGGTSLACIGMALILIIHYETNPTAMDVYQGKTTLEITYKDNVAIDSVVVFKKELK